MPGKVKVRVLAGRGLPVMDRSTDLTDAYVEVTTKIRIHQYFFFLYERFLVFTMQKIVNTYLLMPASKDLFCTILLIIITNTITDTAQ